MLMFSRAGSSSHYSAVNSKTG